MVLSCLKVSILVENSYLGNLTYMEKLQLSWHLLICKSCLAYKSQSRAINRIFTKVVDQYKQDVRPHDLDELKKRIISKL
jgi:hypothetical protein